MNQWLLLVAAALGAFTVALAATAWTKRRR